MNCQLNRVKNHHHQHIYYRHLCHQKAMAHHLHRHLHRREVMAMEAVEVVAKFLSGLSVV